jgi:hypothetical protein
LLLLPRPWLQLDRLVQLLDAPAFTPARLLLLQPACVACDDTYGRTYGTSSLTYDDHMLCGGGGSVDGGGDGACHRSGSKGVALRQVLHGLLMLLPQGAAFASLSSRLQVGRLVGSCVAVR